MNQDQFRRFIKQLICTSSCLFILLQTKAQTGILVTYFNGTEQGFVIANSGKLTFDNQDLVLVTTAGSSPTTIPVSIIRKITFSEAVLPLQLLDFAIQNTALNIQLIWKTENEVSVSHYEIQRSTDGRNFTTIGQLAAFNRSTTNNYSFTDVAPVFGTNYYRLKMADMDGSSSYSRILSVTHTTKKNLTVVPNPASDYIVIMGSSLEKLDVKIVTLSGQILLTGKYTSGTQIPIQQLNRGMYLILVNNQPIKFIKL